MSDDLISDLHPAFQPLARTWLERGQELYHCRITETYRTASRQGEVKAAGASPLSISWHCYGLAFDFAVITEGGLYVGDGTDSRYTFLGNLAKGLDCIWGGDWTHPDFDHIEWHPGFTMAVYQEWLKEHPNPEIV